MGGFSLDTTAYAKATMHGLAHPAHAVNGVFVGNVTNGDVQAMDAIPLFHGQLSLAPMLEVALMQVRVPRRARGGGVSQAVARHAKQ